MAEGHRFVFAAVNHQGRLADCPEQVRADRVRRVVQGPLSRRRSAVEAADAFDIFD